MELKTLTPDEIDKITDAFIKMDEAKQRLERLTTKELIIECLASPAADYLVVDELMDRVMPGWVDLVDTEDKP